MGLKNEGKMEPTYVKFEANVQNYWRAGASQPGGANGAIYLFISGAAYVVSNSTLHAYARIHVNLQSSAYMQHHIISKLALGHGPPAVN